jgi:predicted nucleic acid-binding Zn ribbon protein
LTSLRDCSTNSLSNLLRKFYDDGRTRFYLSEFAEESNCPTKEIEDFFVPLLGVGKIEGKVELRCPNCGKDAGIFNRISDMPQHVVCESCGHKFSRELEYVEIVLEMKKPFFRDQDNQPKTICEGSN